MSKQKTPNEEISVKRRKLSEYQPDPHNANKGTARGRKLIKDSLTELGPGRSLVADSRDVFIAGNQTFEAAKEAGITEVIEITPPPGVIVVVKRDDLDLEADEKAKRLALADNRAQQVDLDFSADVLLGNIDLLEGFWRDDEIDALRDQLHVDTAVIGALETEVAEKSRDTDRKQLIRAVLYLGDVGTFEQALAATKKVNRAEAMEAICKFYLDNSKGEA